jgi:hypothetical protein
VQLESPKTSARSTIRVLALAMSMPLSTIVVQTDVERLSQKSTTTCSSACSFICRARSGCGLGHDVAQPAGGLSIDSTRLWM